MFQSITDSMEVEALQAKVCNRQVQKAAVGRPAKDFRPAFVHLRCRF